jgi:cell division protein FtsI/penicillin-binding protein 2
MKYKEIAEALNLNVIFGGNNKNISYDIIFSVFLYIIVTILIIFLILLLYLIYKNIFNTKNKTKIDAIPYKIL